MKNDISSLRATLEWLAAEGDVIDTDKEVDPDLGITGLQKHLDGGPVMMFNNVKGMPHTRAITNLFSDIGIIDKIFGFENQIERTRKLAYAIDHPIKPREVSADEAPCMEEVITDDLDVNKYITAIRHTMLESELTIGSGISCVVGDYFDGGSHIGYNRMNFRWGNVGTFQISPGSHMWQVITKHYRDEDPVPLTMCFGVPPSCTLVAGGGFGYALMPKGCDEIGIAGAAQGAPVDIVKAKTVDAWSIAESEYVLEGLLYPRDKRYETKESEDADVQGRYFFHPEWAGYMGKAYKAPTFHVTAITMRKRQGKPIIFPLGVHMSDCLNIDTTVREATILGLCERLQPGIVQDVHIPYSMTDWGGCIIQVKKRNQIEEGWQRNFLSAVLSCSQGMRLAIAVSEDVDIYSMDDIMWCLTTRVNPQTDILNPIPGGIGQTFMPARAHDRRRPPVDRVEHPFRGRHGDRRHGAFRLREGLPPAGLSHRPRKARGLLHRQQLENARSRMQGWVLSLAKTGR